MAKRAGRRTFLESASIAVLEGALARRQREAERLEAQRTRLAAQLAEVERSLAALQGEAPEGQPETGAVAPARRRARGQRRRPGGGPSLTEAITEVLRGASKPLRAAQVLEWVEAAGYRSRAKNFKHLVHKALGRHPQAARAGRGLYVYKP